MLTTKDVAEKLQVTERRVRQLAVSHKVGKRVGRDWMFYPRELKVLKGRNNVERIAEGS